MRAVGAFIVLAMSRVKYQSDCCNTGLNYQVFIKANACWALYKIMRFARISPFVKEVRSLFCDCDAENHILARKFLMLQRRRGAPYNRGRYILQSVY